MIPDLSTSHRILACNIESKGTVQRAALAAHLDLRVHPCLGLFVVGLCQGDDHHMPARHESQNEPQRKKGDQPSINQPINQSTNQATNQSNQSINRR